MRRVPVTEVSDQDGYSVLVRTQKLTSRATGPYEEWQVYSNTIATSRDGLKDAVSKDHLTRAPSPTTGYTVEPSILLAGNAEGKQRTTGHVDPSREEAPDTSPTGFLWK